MRRFKRYMAIFMASVIAATSVNMPAITAHAQDMADGVAEVAEATPSDADGVIDISEGTTKVNIEDWGQVKKYRFTPTESANWVLYSEGDKDAYVTLYDSDGNILKSATGSDFELSYDLEAGKTYTYAVRLYSSSDVGSFDIVLEKKQVPVKMVLSDTYTRYVEKLYTPTYISFNASLQYNKGKVVDGFSVSNTFKIDEYKFSVWIRDSYGNYTYKDNSGDEISYTEGTLPKGKYAVVITDYDDTATLEPSADAKVWASYDIEVLGLDEYFAGRPEISETEEKQFDTGEYYKFTPSRTGVYAFSGIEDEISINVYDSKFDEVYKTNNYYDRDRYSLTKGNLYYVRLSGYRYDDDNKECTNVTTAANLYSAPASASITMLKDEFLQGYGLDLDVNTDITLTRQDGTTEKLKADSSYSWKDKYGDFYYMYYSTGDQDWDKTEYAYSQYIKKAGIYTFSLAGHDYSAGTEVALGSSKIQVKSFEESDFPTLSIGENKVHCASESDIYDNNIYKLTVPYEGALKIAEDALFNIFTVKDGEKDYINNNIYTGYELAPDNVYYIEFYHGLRDDSGNWLHDFTVTLSFAPSIKSIAYSSVPEITDFIRGFDMDIFDGAKLEITYVNGETGTVDAKYDSVSDKYGNWLNFKFMRNGEEVDGDDLPLGETEVVASSNNGLKCSYTFNVHRITDYVKGTLQSGSNKIDTKGEARSYYKFTPPTSGIYEFTPTTIGDFIIGHEEIVGGEEQFVKDTANSGRVLLKADTDYYVDLSNGAADKWGETTYEWTLDIGMAEDGVLKTPESWNFNGDQPHSKYVFTSGMEKREVAYYMSGTGIDLTYDDESTIQLKTTGEDGEHIDKFDNRIDMSVVKYDDSTSEYEKYNDFYLEKGSYKQVYELVARGGKAIEGFEKLEIPFEVVDVTDAPDGEWDISTPLTMDNSQPIYVYRIKVPDGVNSLTISSNVDVDSMYVYDEKGEKLDIVYDDDSTAKASISFDVTGTAIYIKIEPDDKNEMCKLTATSNEEVTAIDVSVGRTDYIYGIDQIGNFGVSAIVTYKDGTKKQVEDTYSGVTFKVVDADGNDCGGISDEFSTTGDLTVVATALNMTDTCKVNGAKISVKKLDTSSVEKISLGVEVSEKNTTDKAYTKVYKFVPDKDMMVSVDSDIYVLDENGDPEYFAGSYQKPELKAGKEYYIAVPVDAESTVTTKIEKYTSSAIKKTIEVGKTIDITVTGDDSAVITFVPDKDGVYSLACSGVKDETCVSLYKDGDSDDDSDNTIVANRYYDDFSLIEKFEKGEQYEFYITVYDKVTLSLTMSEITSDKDIASIEPIDNTFSAKSSGGSYVYVSGEYKITYKDKTTATISYEEGIHCDTYKNEIQCTKTIEKIDGVDKAVVELRYRSKDETEWTYLDKKYLDIKETETIVKELTEGVTFDSSTVVGDISYLTFKPKTTGKYVIETESDDDLKGIDVTYGENEWVNGDGSTYYLEAGVTYSITVNADKGVDYKITITKASAIADIEITGYNGHIYKGLKECFGDDSADITVTYVDGTTETITGNGSLKDGRVCERSVEYNADHAVIIAEIDGIKTSMNVAYSNKDDIEKVVFKDGATTVRVPKAADGTNTRRYIYKVIVPSDMVYDLDIPTNEAVYMAKDGDDWNYESNIFCNELKADDVYYINIPADVEYFSIAPYGAFDWYVVMEPTCTENGYETRYDTELGKYVTVDILATGHSYSSTWTTKKAAEYNKDGYKVQECTECGAESGTKRKINKITSVKLGTTVYAYDGKVKKPSVVVKDSKGKIVNNKNYTVTYKNNKAVGKANVTVTFKGDYSGKVNLTFTIRPAATSIKTVQNTANGVKLTWTKSNGAGGYIVYRKAGKGKYSKLANINKNTILSYTDKSAKNGTVYIYKIVACKTAGKTSYNAVDSNQKTIMRITSSKVTKTTNKAGKKMTVKWSVNSKVGGYQIQYSVKSNFAKAKVVKVTGAKKSNVTIAKLAKKKYYVRIRSFKKVGKTTYYSEWSKKTNISIKK